MRIFGALLFVIGMTSSFWSLSRTFEARRPRDLAFGAAALALALLGLLGLILLFVPDFLG